MDAVEAITQALGGMTVSVLDGVAALIDHSLLWPPLSSEQEPRFAPLEIVRAYGGERLAACGELEQTRDAHAAYFLALAEEAEAGMRQTKEGAWQARLEREHENLRAALQWLLEQGRSEEALRPAVALRQV